MCSVELEAGQIAPRPMRRTRISCGTWWRWRAFMRLSLSKGAHPGFPVKSIGVDALHAAFLNEGRTRGPLFGPRTGNPGTRARLVLRGRKSGYHRASLLLP